MGLYFVYELPLLIAALTSLCLVIIVVRRRHALGAPALLVMLAAAGVWAGAYALELHAPTLEGKLLAAKIQYVGIAPLVAAWFLFTVQFTRPDQWIGRTRSGVLLLCVIPALALHLAWTNEFHGLLWSSTHLATSTPIPALVVTHGPGFWLLIGYDYLLLAVGTLWLLGTAARAGGLLRRQALVLLIGILPVWIANAIYIARLGPVPWLDLTPFAIAITGVVYAWSLLHLHLLNVIPVARSAIFGFIEDPIIVVDLHDRIVDVNPAAQQLASRQPAPPISPLVGRPLSALLGDQAARLDAAPLDEGPLGDIRLARAGVERVFELRASSLHDADRSPMGRVYVLRDITKRKQAEEALQQLTHSLEERVAARTRDLHYQANLLEHISDAVISVDEEMGILSWNKAAERIYGYNLADVKGRRFGAVIPTTLAHSTPADAVELVAAGGYWEGEAVQRRADGSSITVWASVTAVKDEAGRSLGAVAVNRDMSGIREMQRALQAAELRYRSLFEDAPGMYVLGQLEGDRLTIVDCNALFVKTLGYAREELIGRPLAGLLAPGAQQRFHGGRSDHAQIDLYGTQSDLLRGQECAVVTADGRLLETLLRTHYERDEAGHVVGVRALFVDIGDRKRMERRLQESTDRLHALGRHLESVREEEQTRIAREVHDELGQLLTVLKMDVRWLQRHLPGDGETVSRKLDAMNDQLSAAIKTVHRIAAELRPPLLDNLGLIAAIDWLADSCTERTGVVCSFDYSGGEAEFLDKTLDKDLATTLFRICQEGLTNVARHAQATTVQVSLAVTEFDIKLKIKDDGVGIAPAQVADPRSFGLIGMRERLLPWNGRMTITGAPQQGTTLSIAIPLQQEIRKSA